MTIDQLREEINKLSPEERAELFAFYSDPDLDIQLTEEEELEVQTAWVKELERRKERMLSGESPQTPVDDFMAQMREKYP